MKYIKERTWQSLNFDDYRARFFIETWWELLFRRTPHFHQARLMNPISFLQEILTCINEKADIQKTSRQLFITLSEFLELLSKDDSLEKVFPSEVLLLKQYCTRIKNTQKQTTINRTDISKLNILVSHLLKYKNLYVENVFSDLWDAICGDTDLKKKERVLTRIYSNTARLVSILLTEGYSSTYLYNRTDLLTYKKNYAERSFQDQLDYIFKRLLDESSNYKVALLADITKKQVMEAGTIGDAIIDSRDNLDAHDFDERMKHALDGSPGNACIQITSTAKDYISATWLALSKLEDANDLLLYRFGEIVIDNISQIAIVRLDNTPQAVQHIVQHAKLAKLLHGRPKGASKNFELDIDDLNAQRLHTESLDRVLRYFRMGHTEISFEAKFLSMWIALESAVEGPGAEVINRIIGILPDIYAFHTLGKRLRYVLELLKYFDIPITPRIRKKLDIKQDKFSNQISLVTIYRILSDEKIATELFNSIDEKEFLKYRLYQIHNNFKDADAIKARYDLTRTDIERQINRIYFIRNLIMHRGEHGLVSPRMYSHLAEYCEVIINLLLKGIQYGVKDRTLYDILIGYSLGIERKRAVWASTTKVEPENILELDPII